jgi:AcrR family transcriptional regulator
LNEKLYLRDPQETRLGRNIIQHSILLIDEIGFEDFTFKKLAQRIESTEASIYRYFLNKHVLLVYLLCWYWELVKFRIEYYTMNVEDPEERLRIAIATLVNTSRRNTSIEFVDEDVLHHIVVAEGIKAYHTKQVDQENRHGYFMTYKALNKTLAGMIEAVNPEYDYPRALASTILEMANHHTYFAQHLPSLTEVAVGNGDFSGVESLLLSFTFGLLGKRDEAPGRGR